MSQRFTAVRFVLGGLLLAAAGLKLYGLSVSAIPRVGWFSQPLVQLAAAEWEAVLGLWLISGSHQRAAWLAALVTSATFAIISGYLGWIGVASCGCFGVIHASPWWAFGVDVAAISLLVLARATCEAALSRPVSGVPDGLKWLGGAAFLILVLIAMATFRYGSPIAAMARLRGEPLSVTPRHLDMGSGKAGSTLESQVELRNWSTQPIRVIGGTSDCSCVTHHDLPISIPPGESRLIRIEMRIKTSEPGNLTRQAILFTDHEEQPTISLSLSCRVE